jgi:hypothetical protein
LHDSKREASERRAADLEQSAYHQSHEQAALKRDLQQTRDDLAKVRQQLAAKERHFIAEVRKRERDFDTLKGQLQDVLRDPGLKELGRVDALFGVIPGPNNANEAEQPNAKSYVERADALAAENGEYRVLLAACYFRIRGLLNSLHLDQGQEVF